MTVYLVGAGPGDPGLLTVRADQVLRRADVVVYDRLSVEALLDLAPAGAERISVGKAAGRVTLPQEQINRLLIDLGRRHATVVRLKGGDPFVFARGGEEAAALADAGVPFEIVPGITSAIVVPAYAGIPVTLRHSSTSFTVVTGHEDPAAGEEGSVDWRAVAQVGGTIVILMGVARIERIAEELIAGGLPADTAVAAVRWGTRPEQHSVRATLATIAALPLAAPSVIVVGEVAAVDLAWFDRRPLFGRRVVVTRTRQQASQLANALREVGAEPVEVPVIDVVPPADGGAALQTAAARLGQYDWVVVTSPNGAARLLDAVPDARAFGSARVAAIGPGTARALAAGNVRADLVPERFVAEALLDALPAGPGRVLLARAEVARDVLPDGLRTRGWEVDVVDAYRTVPAPITEAQRALVATADIVTFTSSSTVEHALGALGADGLPPTVACIGPVTAATAREHGLAVAIEAPVHTIAGLVAALVDWGGPVTLEAVVFDFDGLIIDSEWVIYQSASAAFAVHGHDLTTEAWATIVGLGDDDDDLAWATLTGAMGIDDLDRAAFSASYAAQDRSNRDSLPPLPGVEVLVDSLTAARVPIGVASSSSVEWLERHLDRLGLLHRFDTIVGADLVGGVGKPAPDVYLQACADLAADPRRSVALEDSGHGVTAAKAAGMVAVAVPSRITRHNDLTHADLVVRSLGDVSLADLEVIAG